MFWYTRRNNRDPVPVKIPFSDGQLEQCVLCHAFLAISKSVPIQERMYYIPGGGQLCEQCYHEIYREYTHIY